MMPQTSFSQPFDLVTFAHQILGGPMPVADLPDSPMDCATRVLRRYVPGHDLAWYHAEVLCNVGYNRPERSHVEAQIIRAYRVRQDEIRAGVK